MHGRQTVIQPGQDLSSYGPYVNDFSSMRDNLCCLYLVVTEGDHCQLLMVGKASRKAVTVHVETLSLVLQIIRKVVEPGQLPPVAEYIAAANQRVKEREAKQRRTQLPFAML